jgi:sugar phosphate isomerase/epimerase
MRRLSAPRTLAVQGEGAAAMKICVVTDEVSSDVETALEIIRSWGVDYVELRGIGEERYPEVSDYWHFRLPDLLREFDLKVAAISPGLFQLTFPGGPPPIGFSRRGDTRSFRAAQEAQATLDRHVNQLLPDSIEAARRLGTRNIICFNFMRMDHALSPPASDEMIQVLRYATEKVAAEGMQLLIEISEPCSRPADMVRRVDHPAIGINWDPASAYIGGGEDVSYPDGFEHVRPYIRHIHFKDARINPDTGKREWLVNGIIDWSGALRDLKQDGFDGFISVETHHRPKVAATLGCVERVRSLLKEI